MRRSVLRLARIRPIEATFDNRTGEKHLFTNNLTVDDKIKLFGYISMLTAWTSWAVADRLDPLRAKRNGGLGLMGGWLFLATMFFETGKIPACIATIATVSNFFCVRNPLSIEEKMALDKFTPKNK